ncbi:MAG: hypothetical protein IKN91_00115 [Paludibacteraceae bacterium]|nr:hypothetical protein [Paludibacteraceae bacterium]
MSSVSYPGIKSVGYIFADHIPANSVYNAVAGIDINLFVKPTPICIIADATCEVDESNESNGIAQSVTLSFRSTSELPRHRPLAFVIEDVNGNTFLLGQPERPHLAVARTRQTGTPSGESAVISYEVTQTAPIALKPCKMII